MNKNTTIGNNTIDLGERPPMGDVYDADQQSGGKIRIIIIILIVAAIALIAYYFYNLSQQPAEEAVAETEDTQAQTVTIIIPKVKPVSSSINATGSIAARNEVPIGVTGEGGRVLSVYVDAGDWVKAGQILVSMERSVQIQQLEAQKAQINIAKADLQLAQNELDRAQQLIERGFISKADVDRRIATRDSANARVSAAQAQANELRARAARLDIRAPSSGYILERNVEAGQTVSQGNNNLFRMAQNGQLELRTSLSEIDLASVKVGESATITPVGSDQEFEGNIWAIAPTVNRQTRQGTARVAIPFDPALRPGGFASVSIRAGTQNAPILPTSAVQNDGGESFVYIIDEENKVTKRSVSVGSVTANGLIIESGLNGKEQVVLRAGGFLSEGVSVNPILEK